MLITKKLEEVLIECHALQSEYIYIYIYIVDFNLN